MMFRIYFGLLVVVSIINLSINNPLGIIEYKECNLDGRSVEQSESFDPNPCLTCTCTNKQDNVATCVMMICDPTVCDYGWVVTKKEGKCCSVCEQYIRDLYLNVSESDYLNASKYLEINEISTVEPFNFTDLFIRENFTGF